MNFEECLKRKLVVKKSEDSSVASGLLSLANMRFEEVENLKNVTLKVEAYYEVIRELLTALISNAGYKSYSHECLISFLKEHNKESFDDSEIHLIDQMRLIRNDIVYRGDFVDEDFLERNKEKILMIISKLKRLIKDV
ncbi:MAG: hypothetical protein ABH832_04465 [bacterium]